MEEFKLTARWEHDVVILTFAGRITAEWNSQPFQDAVSHQLELGNIKLIVNLGGITRIDIEAFAAAVACVKDLGCSLKLVHPSNSSSDLIILHRLNEEVCKTFSYEPEAILSFAQGVPP